jgi:hypothetical protein
MLACLRPRWRRIRAQDRRRSDPSRWPLTSCAGPRSGRSHTTHAADRTRERATLRPRDSRRVHSAETCTVARVVGPSDARPRVWSCRQAGLGRSRKRGWTRTRLTCGRSTGLDAIVGGFEECAEAEDALGAACDEREGVVGEDGVGAVRAGRVGQVPPTLPRPGARASTSGGRYVNRARFARSRRRTRRWLRL